MSWLASATKAFAALAASFAMAIVGTCAPPAFAQNPESVFMPGEVVRSHSKIEADCKQCHVRFDRSAQPRLCLECHKPVAQDVLARSGHHGRLTERACKACHTDHRGREANIVKLDEKTFDHGVTDFALRGKHRDAKCSSCHKANSKHRDAPSACVDCHRKDDKHKDTLGRKCESCHAENDWKQTNFDHQKTRFPLLSRHAKAKCADCHSDQQHYASTSRDCISCHRQDDKHKGTLGTKCDSCHGDANWKEARFDHARSRFPLLLRHSKVKCQECHSDVQHFGNTSRNCVSCHRKDDVHKSTLGDKCETCHNEGNWKEATRFDHDARFALRDAHRRAKCEACHSAGRVQHDKASAGAYGDKLPSTCVGCHERDDREKGHKGRYGERCQTCHTEKTFKATTFDHARDTRYPLRAKHAAVKCDACHKGNLYRDKLQPRCASCHERDDKHKGQLGSDCASCHGETGWRDSPFDHNRSAFPLRDSHAALECKKCHASPAFKDVKPDCASCHLKEDAHKQRLGPKCDQCHSARNWKDGKFDHNLRSRFKLDGRHIQAKCLDCHTKPVKEAIVLPIECVSCHRRDDIHFDTNGPQCERCHLPDNWRHLINQEAGRAPR